MKMQEYEAVMVNGEAWYPFSVAYEVDGREYSTCIYAKSWEHAEHVVSSMRGSLRVFGELVSRVDNPSSTTKH